MTDTTKQAKDDETFVPTLWLRLRLFGVTCLMTGCFVLLAYRAYVLQVEKAQELRSLAEEQHQSELELAARRGRILDRAGMSLAASTEVESVKANPKLVGKQAPEVAAKLAPILKMERSDLEKRLAVPRYFTWLKRRLAPDEAKLVKQLDIPGIALVPEPRRYYPQRKLAGPLIGWAGVDSVGQEGIELSYDKWLRGNTTAVSGLRDALGRALFIDGLPNLEPQTGNDVVLTIDRFIQFRLEQALEKAVTSSRAKAGVAVAIDPLNGEVLAMASLPTLNPNEPEDARGRGVRNRPVTDPFEPGSTLKTFTITGALEAGVTKKDEGWFCENGRFQVGPSIIHDAHAVGAATTTEVLAKSSNICTAKIAARLGRDRLREILVRFGFGAPTGVDLPGERGGILRKAETLRPVEIANISFGQGMTATPLQLAAGYAAIASGGVWRTPRVVKKVVDDHGTVVFAPEVKERRVISPALAAEMRTMLHAVTQKGGTAQTLNLPGYTFAGKTGTAQKVDPATRHYSQDKWASSFVGFAPHDNPRIVLFVLVDEPQGVHYGGEVAGPVFTETVGDALRWMGVPPNKAPEPPKPDAAPKAEPPKVERPVVPPIAVGPANPSAGASDDESAAPVVESVAAAEIIDMPDFTGMTMRQALAAAERAGVRVEVRGSGVATGQSPAPGRVRRGNLCKVAFSSPTP